MRIITANSACARVTACVAYFLVIVLTVPVYGEAAWIKGFTDRVLHQGHDAMLPPHLSLVLGLGTGESSVAVKQLGTRSPEEIRTFNVRMTDGKAVVVIMRFDQKSQVTHAFLLGSGDKLQKAVTYVTGTQPVLLSATKARSAFQQELQYWSGQSSAP